MTASPANFDRLARIYRLIEVAAFGGDLARARFCLLEKLAGCRSILVLGEGDGRCLERLVGIAPKASIRVVDASAAMLARAQARLREPALERVSFQHADALAAELPAGAYDAVVTLFFLDCFTQEQCAGLVARISASLAPNAQWLYADFAVPARGWRRLRAKVWLAFLYAFFRWETKLATSRLPPAEELIGAAGFRMVAAVERQAGMLRSVLFER